MASAVLSLLIAARPAEATWTAQLSGQSTVSAWAVVVPLVAALLAAISAFVWNYALKRREEKREIRAAARLVDAELSRVKPD